MTDKPIIQADFVKPNLIPSRKVLQLVFEVPEEAADHAMAVLGGIPQSGKNRWCAIARLTDSGSETDESETQEQAESQTETQPERLKGGPISQRAGRWCGNPEFTLWALAQPWPEELELINPATRPMSESSKRVRRFICATCGVRSLTFLDHNPEAARIFEQIERDFHAEQEGRNLDQMEGMRR